MIKTVRCVKSYLPAHNLPFVFMRLYYSDDFRTVVAKDGKVYPLKDWAVTIGDKTYSFDEVKDEAS